MKKLFLLSMLICLSVVARAADVVIDGIFYNLSSNDKTAEVTRNPDTNKKYEGAIVIPETISFGGVEYKVSKIGGWAFIDCTSLSSVVIPESVTYIGGGAFQNCSNLYSINIPSSVTFIDGKAFYGCSSITSLIIPNSVTYIGDYAFQGCYGSTSLSIGNSVKEIGVGAFQGCSGLTSVKIPNSVTTIRKFAFSYCTGLKSVTLGKSVKYIGESVFSHCSNLEDFYSFAKTVPVNPYSDKTNYFNSTSIENATLYVPASSVEQYKSLIPWYGFGTIAPLDYIDGIYYNFNEDDAEVTFRDENYNSYSGEVVIPATVTSVWGRTYTVAGIGEYAFKGSRNMSTVTIPGSVKTIGIAAFDGCSGLSSIALPENVSNIGNVAFRNCSGLSSVVIPNNVTTINVGTFYRCASLASITIPSGIEYISNFAFQECKSLADVYCLSESVPKTNSTAFDNTPIKSATLHTPNKSIHLYKSASLWGNFGNFAGLYGSAHTMSYTIDGSEYKSYKVWEDEKITPEDEPAKEGYTFSGWSEIPEWMPAHDVTVTGSFSINSYALTYIVDGKEYKKYEIEYSTSIIPETEPAKEGYTFSGWSEIPETMPAHDVTVSGSFSINSYKLTYMVDGEEYKSYQIDYGTSIAAEVQPTKVGYTFSGWSEIPETMPAHDVTVTGNFTINSYTLTYMVDNEVYKTYEVEYGTNIIPEEAPQKTGYTFSGWNDIPSTMPAKDITISGTFTINSYKLTYVVDGVEYKTFEVEYDSAITPEEEPTKEGHTFSGWSEIPDKMPANDVTVTGSFSVNSYTLTYVVDGEVYKTIQIDYGTIITPEESPTKTGYTFFGWDEVPSTMPARDVTVNGTFAINSYMLTYLVDGEEYKTFEIVFDTAIIPEAEPTKEGYTFSGWSEIPETMPANDVTVTGSFIVNKYQVTYIIDGEVFATDYVEYGAAIIPPNVDEKEGFTFSGWADVPETMPAHNITIYGSFTSGIAEIMIANQRNIRIYLPNGKRIDKLQKGLNIVILDDGTVKKVIIY